MKGLCVNISKVDYVYTLGEETGVCVELIQYPVFTRKEWQIFDDAETLARELLEGLYQASYTLVTPEKSHYYSRKQDIREQNKTKERVTLACYRNN
jgi:hypothetical protein